MAIFEKLPTVNRCCCCFSLKYGSVMIALLGILSLGNVLGLILAPMCSDSAEIVPAVAKYIRYIFGLTEVFVFLASIILLISIIIDKACGATIFLYAATLYLLVGVIFFAIAVISVLAYEECQLNFSLVTTVLAFLLTFYFIIVVRSFRGDMAD